MESSTLHSLFLIVFECLGYIAEISGIEGSMHRYILGSHRLTRTSLGHFFVAMGEVSLQELEYTMCKGVDVWRGIVI
jgi:hypothetical protein